MKCGVKFCGGCNPGYQRGDAYREIKAELEATHEIEFQLAQEEEHYDRLLVIGGCSSCCASHSQYDYEGDAIKMYSRDHIPRTKERLTDGVDKR